MLKLRIVALLLAVMLVSGCSAVTRGAESGGAPAGPAVSSAQPAPAKYEFDPHLYVPMLADDVPQEYWDAFHNLCDALRAGKDVFECASEQAYKWATDPATLNALFPAACTKIKSKSDDGSKPFENGEGRIFYQMPAEDFARRQAEFEDEVVGVLNSFLEPDDDDFEKCMKIYDYMATNYSYQHEFVENKQDGANYVTVKTQEGQCIDIAGVYSYFLLQAGVQAVSVGCYAPGMDHAWTYLVIGGKGYHSDATWALKSELGSEELSLDCFLMSGERRAASGCPVDDLTAPLLPKYWANNSSVRFTAESDEYRFPEGSVLVQLDESDKTVRYRCEGEERELTYARAR